MRTLASVLLTALICVSATAAANGITAKGETLYQSRCGGCHSIEENGPGPKHRGLVGCRAGTQAGFTYSAALSDSKLVWSKDTLDQWLLDPAAMVPGTSMPLRLANDPNDRAALVSYLLSAGAGPGDCQTAGK